MGRKYSARRKFTEEFKREAVRLSYQADMTITQVSLDLGVNENMLHRWRKELASDGKEAFRGNGRRRPDQEEMQQLRLENQRLREERDILKKATLFFAKESQK